MNQNLDFQQSLADAIRPIFDKVVAVHKGSSAVFVEWGALFGVATLETPQMFCSLMMPCTKSQTILFKALRDPSGAEDFSSTYDFAEGGAEGFEHWLCTQIDRALDISHGRT